ncbi:nucleoside phosphorylase domain-containing protein [Trichoderma ceciliae]
MLSHKDYTVGWVCALAEATGMLDVRHPDLPQALGGRTIYKLGSIGKHNIVIASSPNGPAGGISGAYTFTQMVETFTSIKVCLMIGIGSVSSPTGRNPGVVQFDIGKNGYDIVRTGALTNLPRSLLTALSRSEKEHKLKGSMISENLHDLELKSAESYPKPGPHMDVLFRSSYRHITNTTSNDFMTIEEDHCQLCDKSQIITRVPRGMRASGFRVKSPVLRNRLNEHLNYDALCIESEAAGLMNNAPCILIRGICDYADSHRNEIWQQHAAALAAAFAKKFMGYINPDELAAELPYVI